MKAWTLNKNQESIRKKRVPSHLGVANTHSCESWANLKVWMINDTRRKEEKEEKGRRMRRKRTRRGKKGEDEEFN
ncbi:hypothetical protein PoB_003114800 [Plakobranchus ocellatus]|uniref:Uncharacterized protein n=1 Tax=Plakobranchus ocellatus TaxID=259542 RepID=A0AAV4ABK6_9GAST|nr:hypothetical protein PoB_003114800 [Plakobranchus ocellatus]